MRQILRMSWVLLVVVMMLTLVSCDKGAGPEEPVTFDPDKEYKVKVSLESTTSHPFFIVADQMAKAVKERTKGKVVFELYPNNMLGSMKTVLDSIRNDTVQMTVAGTQLHIYEPMISALELPFLFEDFAQAKQVLHGSDKMDGVRERLRNKVQLRVMGFFPLGFRSWVSKTEIKSFEDFKGQRLRVPNMGIYIEFFKNLGINGQALPFVEAIPAIEQGVSDGMDGAISSIAVLKLYEMAPNIFVTRHQLILYSWIVSEKFYNRLPEAYQKIIEEESEIFVNKIWHIAEMAEKQSLVGMKKAGAKLHYPDADTIAKMKAAGLKVNDYFYKEVPGSREFVERLKAQ